MCSSAEISLYVEHFIIQDEGFLCFSTEKLNIAQATVPPDLVCSFLI